MSRGIAQSPSYLSTLLHAVDTSLVQASSLPASDKALATQAITPYVLALHSGDIDSAQVAKLLDRLIVKEGDIQRLATHFNAEVARTWLNALRDI